MKAAPCGSEYLLLAVLCFTVSAASCKGGGDALIEDSVLQLYVSPGGDDNAGGTQASPVRTLGRAQELVRARPSGTGALVHLAEGIYSVVDTPENLLALSEEDSGASETFPVIYKSDVRGAAVLSGATHLRLDFTEVEERPGLFVATLPSSIETMRSLYINGEKAIRSREPDANMLGVVSWEATRDAAGAAVPGYYNRSLRIPSSVEGVDASTLFASASQQCHDVETPNPTEVVVRRNWSEQRIRIQSAALDAATAQLVLTPCQQELASIGTPLHPTFAGQPFYLENALAFVDSAGEWFFDPSEHLLYIIPPTDDDDLAVDLGSADIAIPQESTVVRIEGQEEPASHLGFQGVRFAYTAYPEVSERGFIDVRSLSHLVPNEDESLSEEERQASPTRAEPAAAVSVKHARQVIFSGNVFTGTEANAISLHSRVDGSELRKNTFEEIGGTCMSLGEDRHAVTDDPDLAVRNVNVDSNIIDSCGEELSGGQGVTVLWAHDINISGNEFKSVGYIGIAVGRDGTWYNSPVDQGGPEHKILRNVRVTGNTIARACRDLYNCAAIFTQGNQPGTAISGNLISGLSSGHRFEPRRDADPAGTGALVPRYPPQVFQHGPGSQNMLISENRVQDFSPEGVPAASAPGYAIRIDGVCDNAADTPCTGTSNLRFIGNEFSADSGATWQALTPTVAAGAPIYTR